MKSREEICKSRGERKISRNRGGKRSSEIFSEENLKKNLEKIKSGKFPTESEIFSGNGGKSETGEKCIIASGGMDAPV